jgi:hypothetical protein
LIQSQQVLAAHKTVSRRLAVQKCNLSEFIAIHTLIQNASDKGAHQMPLDPDKLREASEKSVNLSKRMDAFMERRRINDAAEDEDGDEDENEEELEELQEPAEAVLNETPGFDLANPDLDEAWFNHNP